MKVVCPHCGKEADYKYVLDILRCVICGKKFEVGGQND